MGELTLAARLALAGVFALAGLGKLADRPGSQRALWEFGLPEGLGRVLAPALPVAELAVAAALVAGTTSRAGAAGALVLLGAFTLAVAVNLARGRTPDCHCFGQVHSRPIGAGTLVRNAVLAAAAAAVFLGPPGRLGAWWPELDGGGRAAVAAAGLLAGVAVLEGLVLVQVLRQQGRLVLRLDALEALVGGVDLADRPGLPVGSPAPSFSLPDPWGATVTLEQLLARGRPVMLLFADPGCGPCNELFDDVARWQDEWRPAVTIAVVSAGPPEANRAKAGEHGLRDLVVQERREVATAYATSATPSAVLVGADGKVASPLVAGGAAIWKLLLRTPAPERAALSHDVEITV